MWQEIHQLDQQVTLIINSWHSAFTDPIWQFFSDRLVWIPLYVVIIAFLIWRLGWKRGLAVIAAALLTFGACDQLSNIVKDATARLRPCNDDFMLSHGLHVLEGGGRYGFFSAHAANAFGLAVSTFVGLASFVERRRGLPGWVKAYGGGMLFWAAMVSVSRVFVGKHYLGDVLAGILVGILVGYASASLVSLIVRRFGRYETTE